MSPLQHQQQAWDTEAAHLTVRRYRIGSFAGTPQDLPRLGLRGIASGLALSALFWIVIIGVAAATP